MAAAEARAVWQRTVNRYFVQEDAKRAPKLACCPSTSSASSFSSSKQVDSNPNSTADGSEQPASGFIPLKRNPNLPPDMRWWLHLQPSYACQKGFSQVTELDITKFSYKCNDDAYLGNEEDGSIIDEIPSTYSNSETEIKKQCYEVMETNIVRCSASEKGKELCFVTESPWLGAHQKDEPWWRTADRDQLASLVAHKSLDNIENCDLPRPQNSQNSHVRRDPLKGLPVPAFQAQGKVGLGRPNAKKWEVSAEERQLNRSSDKSHSYNTAHKCKAETRQINECGPSKAELLEALRHSQTRAREAEKAAKQACEEKEHIIKLFFRQASHLFAYKQWFKLLQLENIYIQYKNKWEFCEEFTCTPHNARKIRKRRYKIERRCKRGCLAYDMISAYAFAFALGLSLVGAGLLLGWMLASS